MKIKKKRKIISLKNSADKFIPRKIVKRRGNPRTDDEDKIIRKLAYQFMFLKSLENWDALKKLGYGGKFNDEDFCKRHGVVDVYLSHIVHRKYFKQGYFDYVTNCISKDFPKYLLPTLYKGKEKIKAMQILLPDQVGRALTQRNANLDAETDDKEFRNNFFGVKVKNEDNR